MTTSIPIPNEHDQAHAQQQRADQAFDALNPDFEIRYDSSDVTRRAMAQLTEELLANGLRVHLDHLSENERELGDDRTAVISHRAALARERAAEEAFTELNPDFGVVADRYDPDQQRFVQQREAALALGTRVALMTAREQHPDRHQRQAAITGRARSAAHQGRTDRLRQARSDRPQPPAVQRHADRGHRRSGDRRSLAEQDEERTR